METKHKAYKFRLYPNTEQRILLAKTFGCVRLVYNHYLDKKINTYKETGKSISYNKCAADIVLFKKEKPFLKEIDSIALQQSLRHLDIAYQNFFRDKKVGFPKSKSKKEHNYSYSSICINNNIRIDGNTLLLPKIGMVRIKQHRKAPADYVLKSVTVSQTPSGKYYASILYEYETSISPVRIDKVIGLDYSMHNFFVSSEEEVKADEQFLHCYKNTLEQLSRAQQVLSRRIIGSNRYNKQRIKINKIHEKIANQRKDYLHKLSLQIANAYDLVCTEDLDMKNMSQSMHFGQTVFDNGWGLFLRYLDYKLSDRGKRLIKVDKWFASSKTCYNCGYVNKDLDLSCRKWTCPDCNVFHDRDYNAALNIKREGTRIAFA